MLSARVSSSSAAGSSALLYRSRRCSLALRLLSTRASLIQEASSLGSMQWRTERESWCAPPVLGYIRQLLPDGYAWNDTRRRPCSLRRARASLWINDEFKAVFAYITPSKPLSIQRLLESNFWGASRRPRRGRLHLPQNFLIIRVFTFSPQLVAEIGFERDQNTTENYTKILDGLGIFTRGARA